MWIGTEVRPSAEAELLYTFCCWEGRCDYKPSGRERLYFIVHIQVTAHLREQSVQNLIAAESEMQATEECCLLVCFQCSDSANFIILNICPPKSPF